MNPQDHQADPHHDRVHVVVEYTGNHPFSQYFSGETSFHDIKLKAMDKFGLEHASAGKYALQFHSADLDERRQVGSLGQHKVELSLTLKHEPVKG